MSPNAVAYPVDIADVQAAIAYASTNKCVIAVRTGGHQYSGASSTAGAGILLDMSKTFRSDTADFQVLPDGTDGHPRVRTGISWALAEFNAKMKTHKFFIPHGQCSHVHLGGHVQTGGYGQLGRSFGLFGDHVEQFEIVTADGKLRVVNQSSDRDLFFAVLGGSPGNFGVITHLHLRCHRDSDHPNSRGMRQAYAYSKVALKNILDIVVEMADNKDLAKDFDFCVTVLSSSLDLIHIVPGLDEEMRRLHGEEYGEAHLAGWPAAILLYAQWANTGGPTQAYDAEAQAWFKKIRRAAGIWKYPGQAAAGVDEDQHTPMSELTGHWVFPNVREFDDPYEKRTYLTNSSTLVADGWSQWVTDRIDSIQSDLLCNCRLSVQIQPFGGNKSMFYLNGQAGTTAYSWRDSSIVCVLDCFYSDASTTIRSKAKSRALAWQAGNDAEGIGANGKFSKQDRRVFWGSYGDWNLPAVWKTYYDNAERYNRVRQVKGRVDPRCMFSPNVFSVTPLGTEEPEAPREVALAAVYRDLRSERFPASTLANPSPVTVMSSSAPSSLTASNLASGLLGKRGRDAPQGAINSTSSSSSSSSSSTGRSGKPKSAKSGTELDDANT